MCTGGALAACLAVAAPASGQTAVYNNLTTYLNNGVANLGADNDGEGGLKTLMIADDLTLAPGSAGKPINSFSFTVRNFHGTSLTARTRVTIYADNGANAPGQLLHNTTFAPDTHAPASIQTFTFPAQQGIFFNVPASGKIWVGMAFDNRLGMLPITADQLDQLGQGAYGPPTIGSSANTVFISNAVGNYQVDNPVGHLENTGFSLGWSISERLPAEVSWNAGTGTWNTSIQAWTGGSPDATRYVNNDKATFARDEGGNIFVAAGIAPFSTTVSAAAGTYTFVDQGIQTGTLTKKNFGRLVLANSNTFTGNTTVFNSGTIAANGSGAHLTLNSAAGNALSGDLHIGVADPAATGVAKVSLAQPNQISDTRAVYFDSPAGRFAYLSLRGNSETVAGIVSTDTGGAIENGNLNGAVNTDATLTLAPPAATTHAYTGIIRSADAAGGTGKLNIAVNGPGTQVLGAGGAYTYTGATTVNAGTLRVNGSIAASSGVAVGTGGRFVAGSTQSVKGLNMSTGSGQAEIANVPASLLVLTVGDGSTTATALQLGVTSKIDVRRNAMVINYAAGITQPDIDARTAAVVAVRARILAGFNGGDWLGAAGITSSDAAASINSGQLLAIGYATTADLLGTGVTGGPVNLGQGVTPTVDDTGLIVRLTLAGDADMNGVVGLNDLVRLANHYGSAGEWFTGDFDYNGAVGLNDLVQLANNYGATLAGPTTPAPDFAADWALAQELAAAGVTDLPAQPVPEPGTLGSAGVAAVTLLFKRRRRSGPASA
ncbi:MAG TPA: autotransporter-associated beta strand repeat-containing protein [Tepidisphaeraceae bacterium]|nr:autotransporter-associated beta strand repeat-containing protein [Tepidisphaeraceae bacterium]